MHSPNKKSGLFLNEEYGEWSISSLNNPVFRLENIKTKIYINGKWIQLFKKTRQNYLRKYITKQSLVVEENNKDFTVRLYFSFPEQSNVVFLQMEIENNSSEEISLGTAHIIEIEDILYNKNIIDNLKVFVDSGGSWWAGVVDIKSSSPFKEQWELLSDEEKEIIRKLKGKDIDRGFHNSSGGINILYEPENSCALVMSFLTFNRTSSNVVWIYREKEQLLNGWAGCDFAGVYLKPHKKISTEKIFLGVYNSPFNALEDYAKEAAKAMKVKLPKEPPMGWCSWYPYRLEINEKIVLENAKLIKKHFPGYRFSYIQVDHGWQYQNTCGYWIETNERFPHGIQWLADKLERMGFRLGLWIAIFTVLEHSPLFKEHPECLIKDEKGNPRPMPFRWSWEPHERVYCIDPTHPAAQRFIRETLTYLRNKGVRYWKIDFTWRIAIKDRDAFYYNKYMVKGAEIYRKGLSLVEKSLKGDYIYWCSNPTNLGFGLGSTTMVADDIDNPGFRTSEDMRNPEEGPKLKEFRRKATTIISRYFLHRKLTLLNPDVVEVGRPGDYEEAKIRLSVVALCGGQVFLGDDLTALNKKDWKLLEKSIPPLGKAARPVDLFEHTYPDSYPQIWHLPVIKRWGRWDIVGLFNLTKQKKDITVDFSDLNLKKDTEYLIFEFWGKKFLGIFKNCITVDMLPITTKLILIKEVPEYPMVLSTDMHFSQGGVELDEVVFDRKTNILKGIARRQKGTKGNIFIFCPPGYNVKKGEKVKKKGSGIWILPLDFQKPLLKWQVQFNSNRH